MASSPEIYQAPIERLGLSPRSVNALKHAQLITVGQVLGTSDHELVNLRNFNLKCLEELYQKLAERGMTRHPREGTDGEGEEA